MALSNRSTTTRLILWVVLTLAAGGASAQDDPFSDPPDLFDQPATAAQPESESNPLARQLRELSGRGPRQMAIAIASLARTGNWSDANRLLELVDGRDYDAQVLSDMQQQIGPSLYVRMKQHDGLSEKAKAALDKLAEATRSELESPERLRTAINGLEDPSSDVRIGAARRLLAGGNAAIAELVAAVVAQQPPVARETLLQVLLKLGPGGVDGLRQLSLYGDSSVRAGATESLATIDPDSYVPDLLTAMYAADSTPQERSLAGQTLSRLGPSTPDRDAALGFLEFDFQRKRELARRIDNDVSRVTLWTVTEDRKRVTSRFARAIYSAYRDLADAAARLRRVGRNSTGGLSADLSYRLLVDNDWGSPDQVEELRKQHGGLAKAGSVSRAIADALADRDHLATVGLIRLADTQPSVINQNLMLSAGGATTSPLVRACSSADPRVRYEAAIAAAKLAAGTPYAGSSWVRRCLREMKSLGDSPAAILVETRPDVILRLETLLGQLGYETTVVHSVAALVRAVDRGGDLRLILSKTNLPDLAPLETIDYVRRLPHGRSLPMVFYGDEFVGIDSSRWDAPTLLINEPTGPEAFEELFGLINRRQRLPPLSFVDRQRYRREATDLLTK